MKESSTSEEYKEPEYEDSKSTLKESSTFEEYKGESTKRTIKESSTSEKYKEGEYEEYNEEELNI